MPLDETTPTNRPAPAALLAPASADEQLRETAAWAASGAMALTGLADGPPLPAPAPFAGAMARAIEGLAERACPNRRAALAALDAPALLGEKAAAAGLTRQGRTSPGGSCHLLRCADGWLALNLARDDDHALLPAWLETAAPRGVPAASAGPTLAWLQGALASRAVAELVARGRMMGLALAAAAAPPGDRCSPLARRPLGERRPRLANDRPQVLDLSALWAGPLCTSLLARAGADVIKVESRRRPDGARGGPAAFYDVLNEGKRCVALDFRSGEDLALLGALVERADIVVESARPRALAQLGIIAEDVVAHGEGRTWVSITGYGRDGPGADWVAFGDDAAVAAGCARALEPACGTPVFCSDALADPLAGAHAAWAALAGFRDGGGELIDVSLAGVTRSVLGEGAAFPAREARRADDAWYVDCGDERVPVAPPRIRASRERAHPLGAHTHDVLAALSRSC